MKKGITITIFSSLIASILFVLLVFLNGRKESLNKQEHCARINSDLIAFKELLSAETNHDCIKSIAPIYDDNSSRIGYELGFLHSDINISIYTHDLEYQFPNYQTIFRACEEYSFDYTAPAQVMYKNNSFYIYLEEDKDRWPLNKYDSNDESTSPFFSQVVESTEHIEIYLTSGLSFIFFKMNTWPIETEAINISPFKAQFNITCTDIEGTSKSLLYSHNEDMSDYHEVNLNPSDTILTLNNLSPNTTYYYTTKIYNSFSGGANACSSVASFTTKTPSWDDYDAACLKPYANSYIISDPGTYYIKPVQGNSTIPIDEVYCVEVLWESYGKHFQPPQKGELISKTDFVNGYIMFTCNLKRNGNAVIAAQDREGEILWSWHIWLTKERPTDQIYHTGAIMMDRNLGAIDSHEGGLRYQWGRKDPFIGSSRSFSTVNSHCTPYFPEEVNPTKEELTMNYVNSHPNTFINGASWDDYAESLWDLNKTIHDPCPAGYRVPDTTAWDRRWDYYRGDNYSTRFYSHLYNNDGCYYPNGSLSDDDAPWYPYTLRYYDGGSINADDYVDNCNYWSVREWNNGYARTLNISMIQSFRRINSNYKGPLFTQSVMPKRRGLPIRCQKM